MVQRAIPRKTRNKNAKKYMQHHEALLAKPLANRLYAGSANQIQTGVGLIRGVATPTQNA
jgi:hypothetical protein